MKQKPVDVMVLDFLIQLLLGDQTFLYKPFTEVILSLGWYRLGQTSKRRLSLCDIAQPPSPTNPLQQAPLKTTNTLIVTSSAIDIISKIIKHF